MSGPEWEGMAAAAGVTLPWRVLEWAMEAAKAGWSDPLGRALYAHGRLLNAGGGRHREVMQRAQPETAARWRTHVLGGGAFKTLRMSQAAWLEHQRYLADRQLTEGQLLRRQIRRIRRAVKAGTLVVDEPTAE